MALVTLVFALLVQVFLILAAPVSWLVIASAAKRAADHYCGDLQPAPKKPSRFKAAFKAFLHP